MTHQTTYLDKLLAAGIVDPRSTLSVYYRGWWRHTRVLSIEISKLHELARADKLRDIEVKDGFDAAAVRRVLRKFAEFGTANTLIYYVCNAPFTIPSEYGEDNTLSPVGKCFLYDCVYRFT